MKVEYVSLFLLALKFDPYHLFSSRYLLFILSLSMISVKIYITYSGISIKYKINLKKSKEIKKMWEIIEIIK